MYSESGATYYTTYISQEEWKLIEDTSPESLIYSREMVKRLSKCGCYQIDFWYDPPQITYLLDKGRDVAMVKKTISEYIEEQKGKK